MSDLTYTEVRALLSRLSGGENFIGLPRPLLEMVGDHVAALVLNQALFYTKDADAEGWIRRSHDDWHKDIFVSAYQLRRAFQALEKYGIESKVRKVNTAPTLHFRIDSEVFVKALRAHFDKQPRPIIKKLDNQETSRSISDAESEETSLSKNSTFDNQETSLSSYKDKSFKTESNTAHTHIARPRGVRELEPEREADIFTLHGYYCETIEPAELDAAAWKTLNRALGEKGIAYCKKVVDGCALDDWPDRKFNNSIATIFKNVEQMERFTKIAKVKADEATKPGAGNGHGRARQSGRPDDPPRRGAQADRTPPGGWGFKNSARG